MIKKIIILFIMISAVVMAFSDVIVETEATWIEGYIKNLLLESTTNYHYIFMDNSRPITVIKFFDYFTTLTPDSKLHGCFTLNMKAPGAQDLLAYFILAKTSDWKVRIQLRDGLVLNGYNAVNYLHAPM